MVDATVTPLPGRRGRRRQTADGAHQPSWWDRLEELVGLARRPPVEQRPKIFDFPAHPPGVIPRKADGSPGTGMAMDDAFATSFAWANEAIGSAYAEGQIWLGYAELSVLAQRPEYRVISEEIASEITREWIEIKSVSDDENKADKIKKINDEFDRLDVRGHFREGATHDGFFGRAHVFLDTGDSDDPNELTKTIGSGRQEVSREKVSRQRPLRALRNVEPVWVYPTRYNSHDPLSPDWYKPQSWFVMGKEVHRTRLLTMIGREVPDLLKPVYSFGGLSMTQMVKPYVDNWLRTRQSVSDLLHSFTVFVLMTNMAAVMTRGGERKLFERVDFFNMLRDNRGTMVVDKDTEDFKNVTAPLGGVHELQSQAQEQMCSISRIPAIKLLNTQPAGFNACLVGDTLIETDIGHVPITEVRPGDKVMTRDGFAPVAKVGCTGYATELIEVTAGPFIIRCTPNHPIWLPSTNVFVNAEHVRPGDLLLCRRVTENTGRRSCTVADGGGPTEMATITLGHFITRCCTSIVKFGECITGLFHQATRYIISTKIGGTTNSAILNCYLRQITQDCMMFLFRPLYAFQSQFSVNVATAGLFSSYRDIREPCFAPIGADSQIADLTNPHKQNQNPYALVSFVNDPLRQKDGTPNIVPENVASQAKIVLPICSDIIESTLKNGCATRPRELDGISCVVSEVRRVSASEFVYDIQVAQGYLPEFFANGICVHNSSEGELRAYSAWCTGFQDALFRDPLTTVLDFVQLSLFDEVDPDIVIVFKPLYQLNEIEEADLTLRKAQTDEIYSAGVGAVTAEEIRERLATDPQSPYAGLKLKERPLEPALPGLPGAEGEGGERGAPGVRQPHVPQPRMPGMPGIPGGGAGGEHQDANPLDRLLDAA